MSESPNEIYGEGVVPRDGTWHHIAVRVGETGFRIDGTMIYPLASGDSFSGGDE